MLRAFAERVADAMADYGELPTWADVVAELVATHAGATSGMDGSDRRVALPPSLDAALPELRSALSAAGMEVVVPDGDDPAAMVADVPVGIVRGVLAIAETGSVLVSEHALEDRVVSMLCHRLIQVVAADDVRSRLDDMARWLTENAGHASFVSLMTGPSRTADIERNLTIGVQGPQEVSVRVLTAGGGQR